jgi:XTP/dITP diphosphohydrolase
MKIVLATTNSGKVRELSRLLGEGTGLVLVSLGEVTSVSYEVEETGATFEANAAIKAFAAVTATGMPALAEDSGLEVDALGGAPGVYSARYAGENANDSANNERLMDQLARVSWEGRTARFVSTLVFATPGPEGPLQVASARGTIEGRITESPRGEGGFGYDPFFEPLATPGRTTAEMSLDEKNALSHRGVAARLLRPKLDYWLAQQVAPRVT